MMDKGISVYKLTPKQLSYLSVKRKIDLVLSAGSIVVLSPILLGIVIAIKIDSPGPILFKQKRVGKNKELFDIYKFRTMRIDTPRDIPTHMLSNPDSFITKFGKFLRKTSLDELPQLFNIIKGDMYIVSSRPALWNQYDLIEERDKYGVHEIAPGLTGWAQINGRDELEIPVKARFDGEYIEKIGPWMDLKCFFGTIGSVMNHDGIVEGGTGALRQKGKNTSIVNPKEKIRKQIVTGGIVCAGVTTLGLGALCFIINYLKKKNKNSQVIVDKKKMTRFGKIIGIATVLVAGVGIYMSKKKCSHAIIDASLNTTDPLKAIDNLTIQKKVMITGANSYIGMSIEAWLNRFPENYEVDTLNLINIEWDTVNFEGYDAIFHVAGIAHQKETKENTHMYYEVNESLAVRVAEKAKKDGVRQFIILSSMSVYGMETGHITKSTVPNPKTHYGIAKNNADLKIAKLIDERFKVATLRPPMVYGIGCKGNYQTLRKFALRSPLFPSVRNERSMIFIDNLAEFVKRVIDNEASGLFFPQDLEYVNTSDMVQKIAQNNGKSMKLTGLANPIITIGQKVGIRILEKVFGSLTYEKCDTVDEWSFDEIMNKIEN